MTTEPERTDTTMVFRTLRDRICLLEYPPGTRLREADLAREFGVSRTPIRSVLQRLAHDGLIDSRDGVGTIVTEPDFAEIRDVYRMRLKVAELIGQMTPLGIEDHLLSKVDVLIDRASEIIERFDASEYWFINHDKHALITSLIGNSSLLEIWDRLYFQAARMWYGYARRDSDGVAADLLAELTETRNAIAQRDVIAVGYIQRNHIAFGLHRLEAEQA